MQSFHWEKKSTCSSFHIFHWKTNVKLKFFYFCFCFSHYRLRGVTCVLIVFLPSLSKSLWGGSFYKSWRQTFPDHTCKATFNFSLVNVAGFCPQLMGKGRPWSNFVCCIHMGGEDTFVVVCTVAKSWVALHFRPTRTPWDKLILPWR